MGNVTTQSFTILLFFAWWKYERDESLLQNRRWNIMSAWIKMEDLLAIGRKMKQMNAHECRRRRAICRMPQNSHSLRTVSKIIILWDDDYCNYSASCSINSLVCQRSESVSGEYFMVRMWVCSWNAKQFSTGWGFRSVRSACAFVSPIFFTLSLGWRGERCGRLV